jgi:hypothetical protein
MTTQAEIEAAHLVYIRHPGDALDAMQAALEAAERARLEAELAAKQAQFEHVSALYNETAAAYEAIREKTIEECLAIMRGFRATTPNAQSIEEAIRDLAKPKDDAP